MKPETAIRIATCFGVGYVPVAPGTAGSAAALLVAAALDRIAGWPPLAFAALAAALAVPSIRAATATAQVLKRHDPQVVVIDEVLGQWLALAGARALNWKAYLAAFLLFRLFDVWKPPPVRRLERLSGGLGIIADDLLAGAYAALVLFLMGCFNLY